MATDTAPAPIFADITPHNTNEIVAPRALYVGTGGNIVATGVDGVSVTFSNVPSGTLLPIRPKIVKATGTTATNILGLY